MKQSAAQESRNRAFRSKLRKSVRILKSSEKRSEAEGQLRDVISVIDKASRKNIIHRNKGAHLKSSLVSFTRHLPE